MMTQSGDSATPNFLTPQSPLFHHEFPSLSATSDTSSASTPVTATASQKSPTSTAADIQYGPGPSLRPQSTYAYTWAIISRTTCLIYIFIQQRKEAGYKGEVALKDRLCPQLETLLHLHLPRPARWHLRILRPQVRRYSLSVYLMVYSDPP